MDSSAIFSLLDAIQLILCRISNLKCKIYYQLTLAIQGFQNQTEIYPEILKFHILQGCPHYHNYAKNVDQIVLNTFVSFCFGNPIRSNNRTNSRIFYNQWLTGEFTGAGLFIGVRFFQFFKPEKLFSVQRK